MRAAAPTCAEQETQASVIYVGHTAAEQEAVQEAQAERV